MNKVKFTSIFGGLAMASLVLAMSCANPSAPEKQEEPDSGKEEQQSFNLSINYNGKGGVDSETSVKKGDVIAAPECTIVPGYTLNGWYTDAAFTAGKEATFDDEFKVADSDVNLYAKWDEKKFTVTFNVIDGTTAPTVEGDVGVTSDVSTVVTNANYTLTGWEASGTEAGLANAVIIPAASSTTLGGIISELDNDGSLVSGKAITLTAQWGSTAVPTLATANLADFDQDNSFNKFYNENSYTLEEPVKADEGKPNHYTVKVNATDLIRHRNGGEMAGYWAGIAMTKPNGAKKFKEYSGSKTQSAFSGDWTQDGIEIKDPMPNIDEAEDGSAPEGYACWGNKDTVLNDKAYFAVQWLNEKNETLDKDGNVVPGVYYAFTLDLSGVTCKYDVANLYADLNKKVYNDTAAGNAKYEFGEKEGEAKTKTIVMSDKFNYTYVVEPAENSKLLKGTITLTSDAGAGYKVGEKETPTDVHVQITFDYVLTPKAVDRPTSSTEYETIVLTPKSVYTGSSAGSFGTEVKQAATEGDTWADYGVGTALTLKLQQNTVAPTE